MASPTTFFLERLCTRKVVSNLSSRFRHLRQTRNLTQVELAAKAGVGRTTVNAIEAGSPIDLPYIRKCADALQLTEAEWLSVLVDWLATKCDQADWAKLTISIGYAREEVPFDARAKLRQWLDTLSPVECDRLLRATEHKSFFHALQTIISSLG